MVYPGRCDQIALRRGSSDGIFCIGGVAKDAPALLTKSKDNFFAVVLKDIL
jgi:hypothetical protein